MTLRARARTSLSCTETTSKPQPQPRPLGARAGPQIPPRGGLLIGNFQGWIGVYRVQHSFLVVCPKKEKAQSSDVRVKSWLERSISHLEGGGANKMGFLHERKINRCELHNSSDADLGRHPATTDIQRSAGPSKRQASIAAPRTLSRRTADDGPDEREGEVDRNQYRTNGRNWSCHRLCPRTYGSRRRRRSRPAGAPESKDIV